MNKQVVHYFELLMMMKMMTMMRMGQQIVLEGEVDRYQVHPSPSAHPMVDFVPNQWSYSCDHLGFGR